MNDDKVTDVEVNTKEVSVSEEVATLIVEALSTVQLDLADPNYVEAVKSITEVRTSLDIDNENRKAPYALSASAKETSIKVLSQLSIPVTHPNWVRLTEILIKARIELGIAN